MKKKILVIICCFIGFCSLRSESKYCPVVQEALFEDDDFFSDNEVESCQKTDIVSRVQELVTILGVQAVLGLLYISERCSSMYTYLQELLNEKKQ